MGNILTSNRLPHRSKRAHIRAPCPQPILRRLVLQRVRHETQQMDPSPLTSGFDTHAAGPMATRPRGLASWDQPWGLAMQWRRDRIQAVIRHEKLDEGCTARKAAGDRSLLHAFEGRGLPPHGSLRGCLVAESLPSRPRDAQRLAHGCGIDTRSLPPPPSEAPPPAPVALEPEGWLPTPECSSNAAAGKQYIGIVTKLRWQRGYAFVDCPEVKAMHGAEVYVGRSCIPEGIRVGDRVLVTLTGGGDRPSAASALQIAI